MNILYDEIINNFECFRLEKILHRKPINRPTSETEAWSMFVNPIIDALLSDPEENYHVRWYVYSIDIHSKNKQFSLSHAIGQILRTMITIKSDQMVSSVRWSRARGHTALAVESVRWWKPMIIFIY